MGQVVIGLESRLAAQLFPVLCFYNLHVFKEMN
jgi:hypothetical protein